MTLLMFPLVSLAGTIKAVSTFVRGFHQAFLDIFAGGDVVKGFRRIGQTILDVISIPLKFVMRQIADLLEMMSKIPGAEDVLGPALSYARNFTAFDGVLAPEVKAARDVFEPRETGEVSDVTSILKNAVKDGLSIKEKLKGKMGQFFDKKEPVEVNVDSKVCIDGKEVGRNQARHQQDLSDRMGFNTPPYVRRTSAEQGTIPAR